MNAMITDLNNPNSTLSKKLANREAAAQAAAAAKQQLELYKIQVLSL